MILSTSTTSTIKALDARQKLTAAPQSTSFLPILEPTETPASKLYTLGECFYQVNTSTSQKALYGFMATSLVINFGVLVWWLRLYCYKRKHGTTGQGAHARKHIAEVSMRDLDRSRFPGPDPCPRRADIVASSKSDRTVEEG